MGPESLLARKPSFWLTRQAIEEHVLLRHTPSVARACTLKSTHHTRSYISCMISKLKKNPSNSIKSCVAIFPKCTFQAMSESGEDDVCDATPWEWALVWPPPVPLFCCFPTWRGKWALQNRLCAYRHLYPEERSLGRPNPGPAKPHPPQEQTATLGQ